MKFLWLGGWAIPEWYILNHAQRVFPDAQHFFYPPVEEARIHNDFDRVFGYSLGAFLLLRWPCRFPKKEPKTLISPFLAFPKENGLGGKISRTQIKFTRRQLKDNPLKAINDFYLQAGINLILDDLPYPLEGLMWGLNVLLSESVEPSKVLAEGTSAILGEKDNLLDVVRIAEFFPSHSILKDAGHGLDQLLVNP